MKATMRLVTGSALALTLLLSVFGGVVGGREAAAFELTQPPISQIYVPDLIASTNSIYPVTPFVIYYDVVNHGALGAGSFTVSVYSTWSGALISSTAIQGLAPGSSQKLSIYGVNACKTYKVVVDSGNAVWELNESNNVRYLSGQC